MFGGQVRKHLGSGLVVAALLVFSAWGLAAPPAGAGYSEEGRGPRTGIVPAKPPMTRPLVTLSPQIEEGTDSIRTWVKSYSREMTDRGRAYAGMQELLRRFDRFSRRLSATYKPGSFEGIMITDAVADSLTAKADPVLRAYLKANPDEVLTEGRQKIELALMRIVGPPPRMLGFHFVRLANFLYSKADSLLNQGGTQDKVGVEDGVLRTLGDWAQLYQQVHADPISNFQSRTTQEDWILARLEDGCGNKGNGVWQLAEQWMTVVAVDTLANPPNDQYAHEYHLKPMKCPGDTLVIWIDLPNYNEVQREVIRRQEEGKLSSPPLPKIMK